MFVMSADVCEIQSPKRDELTTSLAQTLQDGLKLDDVDNGDGAEYSSPPTFQYTELAEGQNIRLLTLLPGDAADPLSCTLEHHCLDHLGVPYEALSYCWGDPDPICSIIVDDTILKIAVNLRSALHHLRYKDRPRTLWIDAICINQADNQEKSCQVRRMHHVYAGAERVTVWLGPEADDSELAFREIERIGSEEDIVSSLSWDVDKRKEIYQITQQPIAWNAICSLGGRPYWTRVWIVQELAFAKTIVVVAGYQNLCWSNFVTGFTAIHFSRGHPNESASGMDKLAMVIYLGGKLVESQYTEMSCNLVQHVQSNLTCNLSDHRDRIYAVINLRSREDKTNFKIDYSHSIEEVYEDFACWSILSSRTLDILSYGSSAQSQEEESLGAMVRSPDAGSWVPTWETFVAGISGSYSTTPLIHDMLTVCPIYHASRDTRVKLRPLMWEYNPSFKHTLATRGYRVDRILKIGSLMGASDIDNIGDPNLAIIKEWEAIMNELEVANNQYSSENFDASEIKYLAHTNGLSMANKADGEVNEVHGEPGIAFEHQAGQISSPSEQTPEWFKDLNESGSNCKESAPVKSYKLPDTDHQQLALLEAFWRTLIADQLPDLWENDWRQKTFGGKTQPGRAGKNLWRTFMNWRDGIQLNDGWSHINPLQDWIFPALASRASLGRRFMITGKGFMGLAPASAIVGGVICVIEGSQTPLILNEWGHYKFESPVTPELVDWHFVGDCYLHGIMDGEAWRDTDDEKPEIFLIR